MQGGMFASNTPNNVHVGIFTAPDHFEKWDASLAQAYQVECGFLLASGTCGLFQLLLQHFLGLRGIEKAVCNTRHFTYSNDSSDANFANGF